LTTKQTKDTKNIRPVNSSPEAAEPKDALVLGGTPAGIQAAIDLADSGIRVHLVTGQPFLCPGPGAETGRNPAAAELLEAAENPRIRLWTRTAMVSMKGAPGSYRAVLRQSPRYVDIQKCTACGDCVNACPVTVPGTRNKAIFLPEGAQPGCAAVSKQGKAPCAAACPGGIPVQGYVALIAQGRFREALDLIEEAIPFPGICGRVCTHPCEANCRRGEVDAPVAIRLLKRFAADRAVGDPAKALAPDSGEGPGFAGDGPKVAVIGSGPAGMTVADRLARRGYRVTVFEKMPVIGGMMGVGIPAYRLPDAVIEREYRRIQALGVEIRLNTAIGPEGKYTLDRLPAMGYSAVCLAIGAHQGLALHIPGESLPGVVQGIELLKTIRLSQKGNDSEYRKKLEGLLPSGSDTRAVVIGGGNTAMDAARSLKRFGLKQVRILYRRSRKEMPALPEEIEEAEREGAGIEYLTAPVRVAGNEETGVTGIYAVRMALADPDESGRRRPVPVPGSEFFIDAGLIVSAAGQVPDTAILGGVPAVGVNRYGRIRLQEGRFLTDRPGVFAAGDAVTRDRMAVIEAIGMGKKAADEIDAYLRKDLEEGERKEISPLLPVIQKELTEQERAPKPRVPVSHLSVSDRLRGFEEVELGYTEAEAVSEANRCLSCGPCSECMACVKVCKPEAIVHRQQEAESVIAAGAVLVAEDPGKFSGFAEVDPGGVFRTDPENRLEGSAAAAKAMFYLFGPQCTAEGVSASHPSETPSRIGVFVCRCGDEISKIIDTGALAKRAGAWPNVAYTEELSFSCGPEGAERIRTAVTDHRLDRVVLAACSCCSTDQACYSCTFQRIRCKRNLGALPAGIGNSDAGLHQAAIAPGGFSFVNIREQCAWPHCNHPSAATAKATALAAAAVANASLPVPEEVFLHRAPSVMLIGSGKGASFCLDMLNRRGIEAFYLSRPPVRIRAGLGYAAPGKEKIPRAAGVLLFPGDDGERKRLLKAAGTVDRTMLPDSGDGVTAVLPGVLLCEPDADERVAGAAAVSRITAWFGRTSSRGGRNIAVVDPGRCRACGTCVEVCENGAAELLEEGTPSAAIDPGVCTGCGTCAARCPSGAIGFGSMGDTHLKAMLAAVLSDGIVSRQEAEARAKR
jgi:NADPH-dependent glutamate synthase beta subunit-like oxidoreductase